MLKWWIMLGKVWLLSWESIKIHWMESRAANTQMTLLAQTLEKSSTSCTRISMMNQLLKTLLIEIFKKPWSISLVTQLFLVFLLLMPSFHCWILFWRDCKTLLMRQTIKFMKSWKLKLWRSLMMFFAQNILSLTPDSRISSEKFLIRYVFINVVSKKSWRLP